MSGLLYGALCLDFSHLFLRCRYSCPPAERDSALRIAATDFFPRQEKCWRIEVFGATFIDQIGLKESQSSSLLSRQEITSAMAHVAPLRQKGVPKIRRFTKAPWVFRWNFHPCKAWPIGPPNYRKSPKKKDRNILACSIGIGLKLFRENKKSEGAYVGPSNSTNELMIFHSTDLTDLCQSWLLSSSTKNGGWELRASKKWKKKPPKTNKPGIWRWLSLLWIFKSSSQKHLYFCQNVKHLKTANVFFINTINKAHPTHPTHPHPPFRWLSAFGREADNCRACCFLSLRRTRAQIIAVQIIIFVLRQEKWEGVEYPEVATKWRYIKSTTDLTSSHIRIRILWKMIPLPRLTPLN